MAISSLKISFEKVPSRSTSSAHSSKHSSRLFRSNVAPESTVTSSTSKCSKPKKNNSRSPYLTGDRVQLLSRVIEKRFVQKTNIVSSFPLAANLYKTNSGDFKSPKKVNKKIKKSVLTLPNDPAPVPQGCTVSDMNDSEYCNKEDENRKRKVIKKRAPNQNKRKARVREKDIEYHDRDAKYCSQFYTNLDCSSTDMTKSSYGDGKRVKNRKKNIPTLPTTNKTQTASNNLSDVWAVLRNINRFQFRPSPPMSEDSIVQVKKNVQIKSKQPNRKDARMIETNRTQPKFSYISRYDVDQKSPITFSPSSSIDRVTVIENEDNINKICEQFQKKLRGTHDVLKDSNTKNRMQAIKAYKSPKSNVKAQVNAGSKENKQLISKKKKIQINLKSDVVGQSNIKVTNIRTENKDSPDPLSTDTSQYIYDSNILPNKTEKDSMYLMQVGSDSCYTGSSKTELSNKTNEHVSRNGKSTDVAVLNKEHEPTANERKRLDTQNRKLRLLTTMPSSCMIAKLTQAEIKRRLTNMRFPIVVLGKDEVSSSVTVVDYEPPQFNGLDDHIWPFMVEWSPNARNDTKHDKNTLSRIYESYLIDTNSESKSGKANNEEGTYKRMSLKNKKQANDDSTANKVKLKITPSMPVTKDKLLECTKKQKSIVQLKDKMLNFLYKRSPNRENCENDESKSLTYNDKFAMDEINVSVLSDKQLRQNNVLVLKNLPINGILSTEKKASLYKHPWAKAKWASDFIDNVMKKVRRGVYYTQEHIKEASVQARSICDSTDNTQTDSETDFTDHGIKNKNRNNVISIPGFNNTPPLLEIKTLNMNQIAVKHCVTNIMLEFDVTVPSKNYLKKNMTNSSFLLTPIAKPESETKVYKCKTTILNAMLPAELCSILPKMMSSIALSNKSSLATPAISSSNHSCLSKITEQTRNENGDSVNVVALIRRSPDIERILGGRFSNKNYKMPTLHKNNFNIGYDQCLVTELLPVVLMNDLLIYKESPLLMELDSSQYTNSQVTLQQPIKKVSYVTGIQNHSLCSSVQIYNGSSKRMSSAINPINLVGMVESMTRSYNFQINRNLSSYFDILKQFDGKNLKINMSMINDSGVQKTVSVIVSNLNVDSLYKTLPKIKNINEYKSDTKNAPLQCIEYVNTSVARKSQETERSQHSLKKIKRRSFYKLYRKCRWTNQGSGDKCTNTACTPLSKITTLDDFFQVLGTKITFSSVFDGNVTKKIISSMTEMKNWISEINPKQAMLILLLNNKKDTQNLVRFKPVILQGIAVNRITRASELDMEIEVIDRENFNKVPQFEGITYLPESVTNYENLLDELYWIAKTTASDYNKPFDESSERLLKSLLQKRKKLNPSYLRVMARYVGLGLVKTPTEC